MLSWATRYPKLYLFLKGFSKNRSAPDYYNTKSPLDIELKYTCSRHDYYNIPRTLKHDDNNNYYYDSDVDTNAWFVVDIKNYNTRVRIFMMTSRYTFLLFNSDKIRPLPTYACLLYYIHHVSIYAYEYNIMNNNNNKLINILYLRSQNVILKKSSYGCALRLRRWSSNSHRRSAGRIILRA